MLLGLAALPRTLSTIYSRSFTVIFIGNIDKQAEYAMTMGKTTRNRVEVFLTAVRVQNLPVLIGVGEKNVSPRHSC